MTVTVNPHTAEEEKALIEFLEKKKYDYESNHINEGLTDAQKQEVINRDNDFMSGKITARDWNDIRRELKSVYH